MPTREEFFARPNYWYCLGGQPIPDEQKEGIRVQTRRLVEFAAKIAANTEIPAQSKPRAA